MSPVLFLPYLKNCFDNNNRSFLLVLHFSEVEQNIPQNLGKEFSGTAIIYLSTAIITIYPTIIILSSERCLSYRICYIAIIIQGDSRAVEIPYFFDCKFHEDWFERVTLA